MTDKDTDKEPLGPTDRPEEKTASADTSDDKRSREQAASADAGQAQTPSDDDDPFDNMPV